MTTERILAATVGVLAIALAVVLVAASGPATAEAATVDLVAHHSRYDVGEITVAAGTTVTFQIRNDDPIDHELIVGDQAVHDLHEAGTEHFHDGSDQHAVTVPAGKTATLTYRFEQPGDVLFGCHLPGHWDYGMRGVVVVS